MKTYTFKVTIIEGNDEFWEEHESPAKAIPELQEALETMLFNAGLVPDGKVELIEYKDN